MQRPVPISPKNEILVGVTYTGYPLCVYKKIRRTGTTAGTGCGLLRNRLAKRKLRPHHQTHQPEPLTHS